MSRAQYLVVCTAAVRDTIQQASQTYLGWAEEFRLPVSATGAEPATHYAGCGMYYLDDASATAEGELSTGALEGQPNPITKPRIEAFLASAGLSVTWVEVPDGTRPLNLLKTELNLLPIGHSVEPAE